MSVLMPPVDSLVFDLDDTLYPERSFAIGALADVARAFESELRPPFPLYERLRELMETGHRRRLFDKLLADLGRDDADVLVPRMVAVYRAHRPSLTLYEDAAAALERWSSRVPLGLLTDGWLDVQQAKIDGLGIVDRFASVVITGSWGEAFFKPHPRGYEEVIQQLGGSGGRFAYVADNPSKDFVTPRRLGWRSVYVRRPDGLYTNVATADDGRPDIEIASLDELDAALIG